MENIKIQIKAAEAKLIAAVKNGDADLLETLLHDGLLFNLPDGQTKNKAFDIDTYRSQNMVVSAIAARDMEISIADPQTATVAVTVDLNAQWHGTPVDGSFRYLRVWKYTDMRWQIIAGSVVQLT